MKNYSVISLFSGAGGMDLGFKKANFKIEWANDFDKDAVSTYKKNIGDHIVLGDICNIDSDNIPNNPDVIIGGFPCQGFSVANTKRNMNDKRNFLYKEMLRVIKDKQPKIFLAENVKGLLSMENGKVLKMIKQDFENIGYKINIEVLNAADYGVPQARERIIILGNRIDIKNIFPTKTHTNIKKQSKQLTLEDFDSNLEENKSLKPYITTNETIGFLKNIKITNNPIKVDERTIYNHIAYTNVADTFWKRKYDVNQADICDYLNYWKNKSDWSVKKIDEYLGYKYTAGHWFRKDNNSGSIPSVDDWWELKKILNFDNKYDKYVTDLVEKEIVFEQSLRITNWNRPSDTITATSPEIHINKKRRLSVRECAMLQTFPDEFVFEGSLNSMHRQVGNAVPVKLAHKIADCTRQMLKAKS
ncbi:MAG: DNA cytosine methyltransferase [Methanobacteriaceae archaeon]|nr:DNA cytosine methyltransferase [Methanobacteriaceae archaeon]